MTKPKARFTRGRKNYYPIPHPETGEIIELFNVSALSKTLDNFVLNRWNLDTVARVISQRPDLRLLASTGNERQAQEKALDGEDAKANIGTAIHTVTEMIDDGSFTWEWCPAGAEGFAARYIECKERFGLKRIAAEYTVYNFTHGYAGTADGAYTVEWPEDLASQAMIGDVKTGSGIYPETAIQLGAYANAEGGWIQEGDEPGEGRHVAIPTVRTDIALGILLHDNSCELIPVKIGHIDAVLSALATIRDHNSRRGIVGKPFKPREATDVVCVDAGSVLAGLDVVQPNQVNADAFPSSLGAVKPASARRTPRGGNDDLGHGTVGADSVGPAPVGDTMDSAPVGGASAKPAPPFRASVADPSARVTLAAAEAARATTGDGVCFDSSISSSSVADRSCGACLKVFATVDEVWGHDCDSTTVGKAWVQKPSAFGGGVTAIREVVKPIYEPIDETLDVPTLRRRIQAMPPEARKYLAGRWPKDVPSLKSTTHTHGTVELEAIAVECAHTEMWFGLAPVAEVERCAADVIKRAFPAAVEVVGGDPQDEPVNERDREDMRSILAALPRATFHEVERIAKAEGVPNIGNPAGHSDPFLCRHYDRLFVIMGDVGVAAVEARAERSAQRKADKQNKTESESLNV